MMAVKLQYTDGITHDIVASKVCRRSPSILYSETVVCVLDYYIVIGLMAAAVCSKKVTPK